MAFNPPPDYKYAMTSSIIARQWPKLVEEINFTFESEQTPDFRYNCVAWAIKNDNDWIQFDYNPDGSLRVWPDLNLDRYIDFFAKKGFEECPDGIIEEGYDKICLYGNGVGFTHVCRQLDNDKWASKIGEFEDIYHNDLDCLTGGIYGEPKIFMRKRIV